MPPTSKSEFNTYIEVLCQEHDGSETSGGRTEKRNAIVGGVATSRHRWPRCAAAKDVVFDTRMGFEAAAKAGRKCGLKVLEYPERLQLHFAALGSWVPA